jgi:rod shape-determining protein MreD
MSTRKISLSALLFLVVYVIQEAFVTQLHIGGGGFSLFLIFALLWAALSSPDIGALTGFVAGLLIDLSQSTNGAVGQWTFVLILVGFIPWLGIRKCENESIHNYLVSNKFCCCGASFVSPSIPFAGRESWNFHVDSYIALNRSPLVSGNRANFDASCCSGI